MHLTTWLTSALTICLLALAACESTPTPTPLPTSTPTPNTPLPTVSPLPSGILLTFETSGCIDGRKDTLTLHTDGALELTNRRGDKQQGQSTPQDMQTLQQLLASPEFVKLQPLYQAVGADLCVYTITATLGDGSTRTVETMDAAPTPDFLAGLIKQLGSLRTRVR